MSTTHSGVKLNQPAVTAVKERAVRSTMKERRANVSPVKPNRLLLF